MGLIANWFAHRRHGGRPRALAERRPTPGRRLSFVHCEQRLTLSAAAGSLAESFATTPAEEGGVISFSGGASQLDGDFVQTSRFTLNLAGNAWQATSDRVDLRTDIKFSDLIEKLPKLNEIASRSLALADLAFDAGPRIVGNAFRPIDGLNFDIGAAREDLNAESNLGSYLNPDPPNSLVDSGVTSGNVLPITPADPIAPHEGGHIAMTAYAGLSPLGLPGSWSSSVAARASIQDEGGVRPGADGGEAVNGLRGRAVVYEVAQAAAGRVDALHAASDSLLAEARSSRLGVQSTGLMTAGSQTRAANRNGGVADAVEPIAQSAHGPRLAATSYNSDTVALGTALAHSEYDPVDSGGGAAVRAEHDAAIAAIDAAFATERGEVPGVVKEAGGLAAFADRHQRHIFGLAAALVVGGGPLGKLLLRRRHRDFVEQRPPQRRLKLVRLWR